MRPRRLIVVLACALGCAAQAAPKAPPGAGGNLAYRETYIWYLAAQLAAPVLAALAAPEPLPPEDRHQYEFELTLLYHRALIACDGPLDEIAATLEHSYAADKKGAKTVDADQLLNALANAAADTRPILDKWNARVFPAILDTFRASKASTRFPDCTNPRYTIPPEALAPAARRKQ